MRTDFPEAEQVSQYYYQPGALLKIGEERFNEESYAFADKYFTQIFDFEWLSGNPKTALKEPDTIVLTISGLYPAFVQSGFQPIKALKSGGSSHTSGNSYFRKGLVVVQFAITQILIVGTIVVGSQMDFFLNQNMGFEKDAVVTFPNGEKREVLMQKLQDNPGVETVSFASGGPVYKSDFAPFSSPESGMTETEVTELKFVNEFVDEHIAKMYLQEEKMYNAFKIFSAIAILIGCLGLYGLVSVMAVQKTKEIGIRKVLGASVPGIVLLFFNQFIWLIAAAFILAAPLAWFAMDKWLQEFAYHISIGPAIFLVSIVATFLIAGLTISYQSIRAALLDPVKSLRSE